MRPAHVGLLAVVFLATALAAPPAGAAPTITEYGAGLSGGTPGPITATADGSLWFVDDAKPGAIGVIATGGAITRYTAGLTRDAVFGDIADGPGGAWFTETSKNRIGRIGPSGTITEFSGASHDKPMGIVAAADGCLWYAAQGKGGAIVRLTATGATTEFTAGLTASSAPADLAVGPDGALWFTEASSGRIGRITLQGAIIEYATGLPTATLQDIAAGPDGNLWFTVNGTSPAVGRITTAGVVTLYSAGLPMNSAPEGIAAGADGALYVTDPAADTVERVSTAGAITSVGAGVTAAAGLRGIAAGADGALWFAEHTAAQIGRLTVAPGAGATLESDVTSTTASLAATAAPNSQATTAYIEWGTTTAYGQPAAPTPVAIGAGSAPQAVTAAPTGLNVSTLYHARVVATNASGTTYGPDRTFTTTATGAPSVTTLAAGGVAAGAAVLEARVNPEGTATSYRFEWGRTTVYGSRAPATDAPVGADGADHAVSQPLTGLRPNTTYHFRAVATGNGVTAGADRTFTTSAVPPAAATAAPTDVGAATAILHGAVSPNSSATVYRFEWGTTTAYDHATPSPDELVGEDDGDHDVSQPVGGLDPNTTYHARVVATSLAGTTYGADQTFTTAPPPADQPLPAVTSAPADGLAQPEAPLPAAAGAPPAPQFGRTVAATAVHGTVRFRSPDGGLHVLDGTQAVRSGSTFDTTTGELRIASALDRVGHVQRARFRGARFRLVQPASRHGMVLIQTRERPTGCGPRGRRARAVIARKRHRTPRPLWASDDHGRYQTDGGSAAATVRGTEWITTETCAGTRFTVRHGSVSVYDKRKHRRLILRAGRSYLAS